MKIINPIYDVAFKYLMEDNESAKSLLSAILGKEVISADIQAQEFVSVSKLNDLRLFRIDFKAVIRDESGALETALLEIQKSKSGFKIERFQSYLGLNYLKQNTVFTEDNGSKKVGYPIKAIYFLGFRLKNVKVPFLKVERHYVNGFSKHRLNVKEDFVEKLSHDLYAIQIPRLKMQVRTELEKMLDIFNHTKYKTADSRVFEYTGDTSNPKIAHIVKHLGRAIIDNDDLLHAMLVEDEFEAIFEEKRIEEEAFKKEAEALKRKNAALKQQAEDATKQAEDATKQAEDATKQAALWKAKFDLLEKEFQSKNAKD